MRERHQKLGTFPPTLCSTVTLRRLSAVECHFQGVPESGQELVDAAQENGLSARHRQWMHVL